MNTSSSAPITTLDVFEGGRYNFNANQSPPRGSNENIFSTTELAIYTSVIGFFCLCGLVMNTITFLVLMTSKNLSQSPFNVMLTSLCVSDIILSLNFPLHLHVSSWGYYNFGIPDAFCNVESAIRYTAMHSTIWHILSFSLLRLSAVQFPRQMKRFSVRASRILIAILWIVSFFSSGLIPTLSSKVYSPRPPGFPSCTLNFKWAPVMIQYIKISVPLMIFLPFLAIIICAVRVSHKLFEIRGRKDSRSLPKSSRRRLNRENSALLQIFLIVASFIVGFTGITVFRFIILLGRARQLSEKSRWIYQAVSFSMMYVSQCFNPIFYNLGSSQLRKATRACLSRCFRNPNSPDILSGLPSTLRHRSSNISGSSVTPREISLPVA